MHATFHIPNFSFSRPPSAQYYPSAPLRNRNSDLSIWISVDPMVDKYPNLSPYTYCADNPVRCVDADGENENSLNPSFFVGGEVGISENVAYFMNSNSFQGATTQNFLSLGGGEGIGVSFGFGEGVISLGGGIDLGGGLDFGNLSNVTQSISLSYKEADNINKLSDVIAPNWTVEDIVPKKNNTGKIIGYNGTVYTKDSRGNKINTKIVVSSDVARNGNSNNLWKSKEYENGL